MYVSVEYLSALYDSECASSSTPVGRVGFPICIFYRLQHSCDRIFIAHCYVRVDLEWQ